MGYEVRAFRVKQNLRGIWCLMMDWKAKIIFWQICFKDNDKKQYVAVKLPLSLDDIHSSHFEYVNIMLAVLIYSLHNLYKQNTSGECPHKINVPTHWSESRDKRVHASFIVWLTILEQKWTNNNNTAWKKSNIRSSATPLNISSRCSLSSLKAKVASSSPDYFLDEEPLES